LWNLEQRPDLATAFGKVVTTATPITLEPIQEFQLIGMGLVHLQGNKVIPSCDVYRQYFRDRLKISDEGVVFIDGLLKGLPILIKSQPLLFSIADLHDLLQTLAPLKNNPPESAQQILRDWCKVRQPIRDALRDLAMASDRAQVKNIKPSNPNDSKPNTNFFQQLSQQVKDRLEKLNESNLDK
jgi:AAA-like domain